MRQPLRIAAITTILLASTLGVTACTGGTTAKPSASPSATVVDQRVAAATTAQTFYNHIFNLSSNTVKQVTAAVPSSLKTDSTTGLPKWESDKQAQTFITKVESIDSQFTTLDTSGLKVQEKATDYAAIIAATSLFKGYTIKIDAKQVVVKGTTATVPGKALTLLKDGKTATNSDGSAVTNNNNGFTLKKVDGRWLVQLAE